MIEFTSSLPKLAKGSDECTRQLEYSNIMVSVVQYIYTIVYNVYPPRLVQNPWRTKLPEVAAVGVQDLNSVVAPFAHIDIPLAVEG